MRATGCIPVPRRAIRFAMRPPVLALALALVGAPLAARAQSPASAVTAPLRARIARATVTLVDVRGALAQGVVLAGTGRILTALDPLRDAADLRVVYPDGRRDRVRVLAADTSWGVALLEGEAGSWPEGISLAPRDARTRDPVAWLPAAGGELSAGALARRRSYVSRDATLLRDAWEIDPVPAQTAVGGALLHATDGTVLGVIVPPASNEITGAEVSFGVPLPVLRALVDRAGESSRPWVGITFAEILGGHGDVSVPTGGLRVRVVEPDGPGARAGLRGGTSGDIVVAVDGRAVRTIAEFGEVIAPLSAGDTITLQVLRRGATTDVPLTLAARPRDAAPTLAPPRAPAPEPPPPAPRPARRAAPRRAAPDAGR